MTSPTSPYCRWVTHNGDKYVGCTTEREQGSMLCTYHRELKQRMIDAMKHEIRIDDMGDYVCKHGTAMDVHCCNCHNGFIFDREHVCPPA